METIFTEDERRQFKFVFTQEKTYNTGIQRPDITDGKANILLKNCRAIYEDFDGVYQDTNTVLIDDSPIKAMANPQFTSLFPSSFHHVNVQDNFLMKILLPFLKGLATAFDVRCYLELNTPMWSLENEARDKKANALIYEQIKKKCHFVKWKPYFRHTILDLTSAEISWDVKTSINALDRVNFWDTKEMMSLVESCLGKHYGGQYREFPAKFLTKILEVRDNSSKFVNIHPRAHCTRMKKIDAAGRLKTCTNVNCNVHLRTMFSTRSA
jgi:hypothetical protein